MKVDEFEIDFEWRGKEFKGTCQRYQVHNYPQIRVVVPRTKNKDDYYIFYEINEPGQKLYRYPLPSPKEEIAIAMTKELEKKLIQFESA